MTNACDNIDENDDDDDDECNKEIFKQSYAKLRNVVNYPFVCNYVRTDMTRLKSHFI